MMKNKEIQCFKRSHYKGTKEELLPKWSYTSELRDWVEQTLLEAERSGNVKKAERFLEMLREL